MPNYNANICIQTDLGNKHIFTNYTRHFVLKLCILFILITAVGGCNLNDKVEHQAELETTLAFIDRDVDLFDQGELITPLDVMDFREFSQPEIIDFKSKQQDLLLRIKVVSISDDAKTVTLTLSPKYLNQVTYFNTSSAGQNSSPMTQFRNQADNRYYSSQKFAFNIKPETLDNQHYLLISSNQKRYIDIELVDTNSYIRADLQFSQFITVIYSIIFALVLFNAVFYLYTREKSHLYYSVYMLTALYSLLWQEGKINDLPLLAWHVLGPHSALFYLGLADLAANIFFYHFLNINLRNSWLAKGVLLCVVIRIGVIITALMQYHLLENYYHPIFSAVFNISILVSSLLAWLIMLNKVLSKTPYAGYILVAWTVLIVAVFMRIYFSMYPHPDILWMPHSYEVALMLEGLILAFAVARRMLAFRNQRDEAIDSHSQAQRSIQNHHLINQFKLEMQKLVQDPTLSVEEVHEKTNIKFHLLFNKAYPIKNSLTYQGNSLSGICTTGLKKIDMDMLNYKLEKIFKTDSDIENGTFEFTTANSKPMNFVYMTLKAEEHSDFKLVFGLKSKYSLSVNSARGFSEYCQSAYTALQQAKELHQVAMAANLDQMTGCHNRHSIEKIVENSLKNASRTTVAYIDLDDLKGINDQHGHDIGDQCIIEFVDLIKSQLSVATKIGRMGGDEFLATFSDTDFEKCEFQLENFLQTLETETFSELRVKLSTSIGLAESRLNDTKRSLIKKADQALYQAKSNGKNQLVIFDSSKPNDEL